MDYELFLNLASEGYRFYYRPSIFSKFRIHDKAISNNNKSRKNERRKVQLNYGIYYPKNLIF